MSKLVVKKQVKVRSSRDKRKKYTVTFYKGRQHGPECSCPHFIYRLQGTGEVCKHIKAARRKSA